MRFSLVLAALLCLTTWMSVVNAIHVPVASCCDMVSTTKVQVTRIQDYTIQSEGACPIKAVVFRTTSGIRICSDPNDGWAKKAMRKVDTEKNKEVQEKQQSEEGSISTITTAAPSPPKNAPKRRRYGRRRLRRKLARKRKGQRKRV
ncbi:eotaxin-like isoform X2 [Centropristis striata]|uniref:eotaxin-like isoform X2 n=1 Tax=Centropristis striata TaxID=184440 RepID=UPI0027E0B975|nr:eotaxin-like isoform X2 [Centropristis striata]